MFFWTLFGFSLAVVLMSLYKWNAGREEKLKWWQWLIVTAWGLLVLVTAGFIGTAFGEGEPRAAMVGGVIFALISVISGVGLWRWLTTSKKASQVDAGEEVAS